MREGESEGGRERRSDGECKGVRKESREREHNVRYIIQSTVLYVPYVRTMHRILNTTVYREIFVLKIFRVLNFRGV